MGEEGRGAKVHGLLQILLGSRNVRFLRVELFQSVKIEERSDIFGKGKRSPINEEISKPRNRRSGPKREMVPERTADQRCAADEKCSGLLRLNQRFHVALLIAAQVVHAAAFEFFFGR